MEFKQKTSKGLKFLKSIVDNDDCILWPYAKKNNGYGSLYLDGKHYHAHRLSLILHNGEPPTSKHMACHEPVICHNRSCVNPNHLSWKTNKENLADRVIDGTLMIGESHVSSKLTLNEVISIRASEGTYKQIAKIFNISVTTVSDIKNQYSWKYLETRLVKGSKVIIE